MANSYCRGLFIGENKDACLIYMRVRVQGDLLEHMWSPCKLQNGTFSFFNQREVEVVGTHEDYSTYKLSVVKALQQYLGKTTTVYNDPRYYGICNGVKVYKMVVYVYPDDKPGTYSDYGGRPIFIYCFDADQHLVDMPIDLIMKCETYYNMCLPPSMM
jgi:hypothetical protein